MKSKLQQRVSAKIALLLIGGVLLVALLVGHRNNDDDDIAKPVVRVEHGNDDQAGSDTIETENAPSLNINELHRPDLVTAKNNLFELAVSPTPPAPTVPEPVIPEAPPKPTAPPLPFKFIGRMIDRKVPTVFVTQSGQNLSLKAGDVVGSTYRVEKVDDTSVVFVYLPLKETQTLDIGRPE